MIKSLLGEDENSEKEESPDAASATKSDVQTSLFPTEEVKTQNDVRTENTVVETPSAVKTEETVVTTPGEESESVDEIRNAIETGNLPARSEESSDRPPVVKPFEVDKPIGQPNSERKETGEQSAPDEAATGTPPAPAPPGSRRTEELERKLREIEEELLREKELEIKRLEQETAEKKKQAEIQNSRAQATLLTEQPAERPTAPPETTQSPAGDWSDWDKPDASENIAPVKPVAVTPEDQVDTYRNMGMAWSAAIAWFGAVVVMLIIGWFADLFLGTLPWGIVTGIVLGSIIGLVQFVRTTSLITNPKPNDFEKVSLKSNIEVPEDTTTANPASDSPPTEKKVSENSGDAEEKTTKDAETIEKTDV